MAHSKWQIDYRQKGFTLIEILLVLVILTIVSSVGFVSVRSFSERQTLTSLAADFVSDLQFARSRAQAQAKPETTTCTAQNRILQAYQVSLTCGSGGTNCQSYSVAAICSGTAVALDSDTFPTGVSVQVTGNYGSGQPIFRFNTLTGVVSTINSDVQVIFTGSAGNTKTVTISKEGRVMND